MSIFLNLENVDREIVYKILRWIESEFFSDDNYQTNYLKLVYFNPPSKHGDRGLGNDNSMVIRGIELDENSKQINKIKQKVKDILIRNSVSKYIVINDPIMQDVLIVLDRLTAQSSGHIHCRHCGMEFDDEIQLGNHLRIHYMI